MSSDEQGTDIDALADRIIDLVQDGDLEAANEALDEALEAHPGQLQLLAIRAELLLDAGSYDEVISLSNACLSDEANQGDDLAPFEMLKGYALYYTDELDEARRTFNGAVNRDPELWHAIVGRAMVHDHLGFATAAMLDLDRAIELDDEEPEPFALRGMSQLRQGLLEEAERYLGYALDADPDEEESRLNLARIAAIQGRRTEARELLQRLVENGSDPDFVCPGLLLRSQLALDLKDTASASADARKVIELWPDRPWGHLQLAACHIKAMNAGEAITALKEAEDRAASTSDVPDIFALRASAYQQLEKMDKARREYEKVEGMARLPQVVFGDHLNPAANIPINPNKPIDIRRILADLFGEASRAPQGYEALLRNIVDQIPDIVKQHPGVGQLNIELPDAPGMVAPGRSLIIQVNQQAAAGNG